MWVADTAIGIDYCLAICHHSAQQIARMKVLLSLTILCIAVSLSNGACFHDLPKHGIKDGCLDPYNKEKHPFGSKWNSDKCMTCTCDRTILSCCTRYTSEPHVQGCKAVLDKRTCKYKHYKVDNPSELCF